MEVKKFLDKESGTNCDGCSNDPPCNDLHGPEVRFHMKDFWEMPDDPRADRIFKMVHPLVFLPENLPAFEKIQNNWVF